MKPTSQQYAVLSNDGYVDREVGVRRPGGRERLDVGGATYEVLEHVNNRRTGYQGTIYQRVGVETSSLRIGAPKKFIVMPCRPTARWCSIATIRRLLMQSR